jgi:uncharacterized protein (AIM24 family)
MRIQGTTMPVLEIQLSPNESVYSESGELSWMTNSIQMSTHTQLGGGGGFMGALKRVAGGGSLFMTEYRAMQYAGEVAFATKVPGHIVPVEVAPGAEYMVPHRSPSASAFSSHLEPASLAELASCCKKWAAQELPGLSCRGN